MLHWLLNALAVGDMTGRWYAWWSGFGGDIGELALIGGVIGMLRQHNCEVKGCPRLGRHQTAAGHKVCRKHHPDDHLTAQQVREQHETAKGAK